MARKEPNILITGTPGTGKTTLMKSLMETESLKELKLKFIIISEYLKEHELYLDYDPEYDCHVMDEDRLIQKLKPDLKDSRGGYVLDYHSGDLFPSKYLDGVFVLRCDNKILYDRLDERGYRGKKMEDNMTCEIMRVILDEAIESYGDQKVIQLDSNSKDDLKKNVQIIQEYIIQFIQNNCDD